uniref:Uncharacterized protein n=1 Tax=Chaetoceros debilis TaxID=122233 RepID=A0A7S3Q9Q2_9STRA
MRILTSILLGIATLLPTSVLAAPVISSNIEDSGNGNICTSEVVIDCTFTENGVEFSCISDSPPPTGKPVPPFLYVPAADCNESITATVTFQMCNRNDNSNNEAIKLREDRSYYTIEGVNTNVDFTILPGECKTMTQVVEYQKCKVFPLYVQMDGFMPGLNNNNNDKAYCYASAFRKNKSKKIKPNPGSTVYTKQCEEKSMLPDGVNVCNTSVSMQCEYEDDNGVSQSCIGPERDYIFTSVREDLCQDKKIYPTITYTMCNENGANSKKTVTNFNNAGRYSFFKWKNEKLTVPGISGLGGLAPSGDTQCQTFTYKPTIDTCRKNWPLSVKLEGNMRKSPADVVTPGTNSFCYCYLFKKAIVHKYPKPPVPGPVTPPVAPPVAPPVTPPTPACNFSDVIITEIGSPNVASARYVEVFFRDCASKAPLTITEDIRIISNGREFPLQGKELPLSGIIVVCVSRNGHSSFFNFNGFESCNYEGDVANNDGTAPVSVNRGPAINNIVLDIFQPFPFTDGKAMRIKFPTNPVLPIPSQSYIPSQWIILPGNTPIGIGSGEVDKPKGLDPGVWYTPLIISEINDPVDSSPARYINIKSPYGGGTIVDNLWLVIFNESDGEPDYNSAVQLDNKVLGPDNEIRVCNSHVQNTSECNIVINDPNSPLPGNEGCYTVGIILILPGVNNYHIVDLYGRRGVSCAGSEFDFEGGTAVRKPEGYVPVSVWNPIQWIITTPEPIHLIITEVTDPSENLPKYRFVELYSPNKKNYVFQSSDDLYLVTYPQGSSFPERKLSLVGKKTDANGLVVFCTNNEYYQDRCNYVEGTNSVADTPGTFTVQIIKGATTIIDVYGGINVTGNFRDFTSGRVNRKDTSSGSNNYLISDWELTKPTSAQNTDPGCWNGIGNCAALPPIISDQLVLFITEVSDPQDVPSFRFVELYSPNKPNYKIVEGFTLKFSGNVIISDINLNGYETDSNGFIVVLVDNPGTEVVNLMKLNTVIDSYGKQGTIDWNFVDGRANRIGNGPSSFGVNEWTIDTNVNLSSSDPGCWNGIGDCTNPLPNPPAPPSPPNPAPAPSKGGKGGKGKTKTTRRMRKSKRV